MPLISNPTTIRIQCSLLTCRVMRPSCCVVTVQAGNHLSPAQFHQALEQRQEDTVLIDCRNDYGIWLAIVFGARG